MIRILQKKKDRLQLFNNYFYQVMYIILHVSAQNLIQSDDMTASTLYPGVMQGFKLEDLEIVSPASDFNFDPEISLTRVFGLTS